MLVERHEFPERLRDLDVIAGAERVEAKAALQSRDDHRHAERIEAEIEQRGVVGQPADAGWFCIVATSVKTSDTISRTDMLLSVPSC